MLNKRIKPKSGNKRKNIYNKKRENDNTKELKKEKQRKNEERELKKERQINEPIKLERINQKRI